jgi:bifunctional DNA-binding transcriptional regulator/antitoxin component of YhaV-PrlF toxin-antitoxin module
MSKVSSKRQITLPVDLCVLAGINAGDEVSTFVDRQGIISVVKKTAGAAKGFLKDMRYDKSMSDEDSLKSVIQS